MWQKLYPIISPFNRKLEICTEVARVDWIGEKTELVITLLMDGPFYGSLKRIVSMDA